MTLRLALDFATSDNLASYRGEAGPQEKAKAEMDFKHAKRDGMHTVALGDIEYGGDSEASEREKLNALATYDTVLWKPIDSITEFDAALAAVGRPIDFLSINGHGNIAYMLVGEGNLRVSKSTCEELAKIIDKYLTKDGVVELEGCLGAYAHKGLEMVEAFGKALGKRRVVRANVGLGLGDHAGSCFEDQGLELDYHVLQDEFRYMGGDVIMWGDDDPHEAMEDTYDKVKGKMKQPIYAKPKFAYEILFAVMTNIEMCDAIKSFSNDLASLYDALEDDSETLSAQELLKNIIGLNDEDFASPQIFRNALPEWSGFLKHPGFEEFAAHVCT